MAEGFTHARGKAQVLLIEGTRSEHAELVKALREKEIEVKVLVGPGSTAPAASAATRCRPTWPSSSPTTR